MPATFKLGDKVKFVKDWKYGQRGELVCKTGSTAKIVDSLSSAKHGDNRTEAVERDDTKQTVRSIPVAYIEHV